MKPITLLISTIVLLLPAAAAGQGPQKDIFANPQNLKVLSKTSFCGPWPAAAAGNSSTIAEISKVIGFIAVSPG